MQLGDAAFERLRAAIDELAAVDAAALVSEARAEARAKVRSILADAMAHAMLERAREAMEGRGLADPIAAPSSVPAASTAPAPPAPAPAPAPAPVPAASSSAEAGSTAELGWYLYCVIQADDGVDLSPAPAGVDGTHPVEVLRHGSLGAVVSLVPLSEFGEESLRQSLEDLAWLEEKARIHEAVLDQVRMATTVIPMRLCTIYATEESLRGWIARERRALGEALALLAGKTEWGVKLFATPGDLTALAEQRSPEAAELARQLSQASPGEAYLLRRRLDDLVRSQADELIAERCEAAHRRFAAAAAEALLNPLQPREVTGHGGEMVLNGVYLVQDSATEGFHSEVEAVREEYAELGLEVDLTGPWPPYNFVKGSVEAAR